MAFEQLMAEGMAKKGKNEKEKEKEKGKEKKKEHRKTRTESPPTEATPS